ncbi:MAG: hypothetical protein ACKVQS_05375 [Fimbriimonadaceae bacterium]
MTLEYSEIVLFSANPEQSAMQMKVSLGWEEIERFGDSWILLRTPGNGRVGYMKHEPKSDVPFPAPMIAFKSTSIESDIAEIKLTGLSISDVTKGTDMWHASYSDEFGNKILIWQEPQ